MDFQNIGLIVLVLWFVFYLAGRYQQNRVKKALIKKLSNEIELVKKEQLPTGLDEFYDRVFMDWPDLVRLNAKFVLNKMELLPYPAKPEELKTRFNLTPAWLGAYSKLHGLELEATEDQQIEIEQILLFSKNRKATTGR